jgi:hemoglobin
MKFKTLIRHGLVLGTALCIGAAAAAQSTDDTLYRALGERSGLVTLMDRFVDRLFVDPRIGAQFRKSNRKHLKEQLTDQLCAVSGGPCVYKGADMKSAHEDLGITRADFNALVEVLQDTMDAQGLPFAVQNRLLARLAPMHRDVIAPADAPAPEKRP